MSRKIGSTGPAAVSSTPFPKRGVSRLLKNVFENQSLSPIPRLEATTSTAEPSIPYSTFQRELMTKASSTIGPVKPQKRTLVPKKKESANSKALKELKEEKANLYHSRNLYNMHPEPVVLDSDDEEMLQKITNSEVSTKRNTTTKTKDGKRKKLDCKTALNSDGVDDVNKIKNAESAVRQKRTERPTTTTVKRTSRKVLESVDIQKNAKPPNENKKPQAKSKPYDFDPIVSLFNLESLDEEEDCNDDEPKVQPSISPLLKNSVHKTGVFPVASTSKMNESCNDISSFVEVTNGEVKTFTRQFNNEKAVQKKEPPKSTIFPKDSVSKFSEVIFKPNRKCGGIVARALHTENVDFGYVEITKEQTFLGTCPKVTFVMIEGEVNLSQGEKTEILVPGDMLHIRQGQEYQIRNLCNRNARLMYIKELGN